MRVVFVLLFVLAAAPVLAAPAAPVTVPAPTPAGTLDRLFGQLKSAATEDDANAIAARIENAFDSSGSPTVDLLMTRSTAALSARDAKTARALIDAIIQVAPRFAQGWYRRALLQAQGGDDAGAMESLQRTIALNPRHFTAMVTLAGMLQDYGDRNQALELIRRARALNPYAGSDAQLRALTRDVEGQGI